MHFAGFRFAPLELKADGSHLLATIRPEVRGTILVVEAQAHFIRIHTTHGQSLVHHRFCDAALALGALPGERVHRSWWVAADAIDPRS